MRTRRAVRVLLAAAAAFALAASTVPARGAGPDPSCVPRDEPGLGLACRTPEGLWRVFADDGYSVLTHGMDPPEDAATHLQPPVYMPPKAPRCATANEFHNRVIYTYASDRPNNIRFMRYQIVAAVYEMNGFLRHEAAEFGLRMDYRVLCSGGKVSVTAVRLNVPYDRVNFGQIISSLRAQGFTSPFAKYWVVHDGGSNQSEGGGIAQLQSDDSLVTHNFNNIGPTYSTTWFFPSAHTMMHESGHTLGAVQSSAPNNDGGGHCLDDRDVMCYPTAQTAELFRPNVCRREHYDCRHDDYFNPRPKSGTYIASHWNIGSPMNRFISGCLYASGSLSAGLAGQPVSGVSSRTYGVARPCWSHRFVLSGVTMVGGPTIAAVPGPVQVIANSLLNAAMLPDFDVCWYAGSRLLRCHRAIGDESGAVPYGATKATIVLTAGASAERFSAFYVLNAV